MFNTIVQVLLGIIYGLYLAFLAPASQRQKAHESLKQHAVVPAVQEKPMRFQIETSVAEPTEQPAVAPDILQDPWLAELVPATTKSKENPTMAIAAFLLTPKLLLLPTAQGDRLLAVKPNFTKKTKATKTKQIKHEARASSTKADLTNKTVEQLRSLCKERNIKWRNAHGSRHLTKIEMLERLCA